MNSEIKKRRKALHLTQSDLAHKCGCTRQYISLVENGNTNLSLRLCLSICYALNCTLDDIFKSQKQDSN